VLKYLRGRHIPGGHLRERGYVVAADADELLCFKDNVSKLPTTLPTSRLIRRKGRSEPMNIRAISTSRTDLLTMLMVWVIVSVSSPMNI
jgi:hypothetical protein